MIHIKKKSEPPSIKEISVGEYRSRQCLGAENSAAVSLELDNETYIPLHNTLGSIIQLRQNNTIVETITYTAFGETSTTSLSPWLYSSKRLDPESNLYNFGRRFYDPATHRWITCDPKGYDGGPNLYGYVLNCPLTHIDLYGLIGVGSAQTWLPAIGSCLAYIAKLPGLTLELIGQHMMPVPLLRDVIEYSGHVLGGKGINTYVPSYSRNHSEIINIAGDESKGKTLHLQNGICTTFDEAMKYALEMQKKYGGIPVHFTYNGSKGFVTDLIECGMQKLGILTTPDKQFIKDINETAKSHGAGHTFLVIGHSQGGMIIGNSLRHLSPEIKANMHVRTMGTASIISNNEGLASIRNYVSMGDIVYLSDPWGIAKGLMGKSNVTYMKPQEFTFPDHFLEGRTYKLAEKFIQKDFNKINGSK